MREFNIDLVIDKTFNVFADSVEEAKELAIQRARQLMGTYNGLTIDFVEEVKEDDEELERQAEIAEYQRIANTNPYIFWED